MKRAVMNKIGGRISEDPEIGFYFITSRRYSRKQCIRTLLAISPSVRIIYVKFGKKQVERAYLSRTALRRGKRKWHFFPTEPVAIVDEITLDR